MESTENKADSGESSRESFAYYNPSSRSWRTSQRCLIEGWDEFSGTWPRAGMTRSGTAYRRARLVSITNETGRVLLPTPRAADGLARKIRSADSVRKMMANQGRSRPGRLEDALALMGGTGGIANPNWLAWFMGFPPDWLMVQ